MLHGAELNVDGRVWPVVLSGSLSPGAKRTVRPIPGLAIHTGVSPTTKCVTVLSLGHREDALQVTRQRAGPAVPEVVFKVKLTFLF